MVKGPSPLVGYNTNVRHKGKLYHIQTEDSGIQHPHIITHLFADGGRIIASRKTSYAEHIGQPELQKTVKRLMQEQHKAMFIALRDCLYDEETDASTEDAKAPAADVDALERAAQAREAESVVAQVDGAKAAADGVGRYQGTVPAAASFRPPADKQGGQSIFGGQLMSEKSLDEVILSYLAEDPDEPER